MRNEPKNMSSNLATVLTWQKQVIYSLVIRRVMTLFLKTQESIWLSNNGLLGQVT